MTETTTTVADLKEGDRFVGKDGTGWRAMEDAERLGSGEISVRVQYIPDGGIGDRQWDDPTIELKVQR